jgi:hypothetical protein
MSKTVAGACVIGGPVLAWIGSQLSAASDGIGSPKLEWWYTLKNCVSAAVIIAGLVVFFVGCSRFAAK